MDTWDPGEYEYIFLEGPTGDLRAFSELQLDGHCPVSPPKPLLMAWGDFSYVLL